MKFVFDSTPLIHLTKAGLAWTLRELEGEKYTVPSVYAEVVERGTAEGFDDAPVVSSMVSDGLLAVREPPAELADLLLAHRDIHRGEAEAIALAKELGAIVIVDDPVARRICAIHGIEKEGSFGVVMRMVRNRKLGKDGAKAALRRLVASGWRCDGQLYEGLLRAVDDL